jgi:hypothetical protein
MGTETTVVEWGPDGTASAQVSLCGKYRYLLTRKWDTTLPSMVFVMLNPSTADAMRDDPTIRKCIGFARRFGYGGIIVVNLYAFRATKPADLYNAMAYSGTYAKGPDNDEVIRRAVADTNTVVVAWGKPGRGSVAARADQVRRMIQATNSTLFCLQHNNDRSPAHPLMLPYSCRLEEF